MTDELSSADDRAATDSTEMTEGVGGVPDLDDDRRATVSDPDGDNVDAGERPINEEANTLGAP